MSRSEIEWLATPAVRSTLKNMARGIERETLRITPLGTIAQTPHPQALGSALCNSSITTDYSEALLEIITKPHRTINNCLQELESVHQFVTQNLQQETLWPFSMPPAMNSETDIPIADYGQSVVGLMKHIYRRGLGVRYGRKMQSIAGVHYNLSYPDDFWHLYQAKFLPQFNLIEAKNHAYFKLTRQFLRDGWMLTIMTGASPACHTSFISPARAKEKQLNRLQDYFLADYGCSLRMGGLGYQNPAQSSLFVCFDSLEQYVHTLSKALSQPHPDYIALGLYDQQGQRQQLSTSVLQIENEFYGSIRPKQISESLERPTLALEKRGVAYIEIRNIDIDPHAAIGINALTAAKIEIFVTGCLLSDKGLLNRTETLKNAERNEQAAMAGRKLEASPDQLTAQALQHWEGLKTIAQCLSSAYDDDLYLRAFELGRNQLQDPTQLTSAALLQELKNHRDHEDAFTQLGLAFSKQHHSQLCTSAINNINPNKIALTAQAQASLAAFAQLPAASEVELNATLVNYFRDLPVNNRSDCAALFD